MFLLRFTLTCRRSSLGDFNWATRAFINCRKEHNKALLAPSPKVRFVKAIPAYRRSVTQYWSDVVLPWASWSTWKTQQTHYENEIVNVHCDGKVSVMKTTRCQHEHPTTVYMHHTINLEYQNAKRINKHWFTFSEFLTSCYRTQLTASYTESWSKWQHFWFVDGRCPIWISAAIPTNLRTVMVSFIPRDKFQSTLTF